MRSSPFRVAAVAATAFLMSGLHTGCTDQGENASAPTVPVSAGPKPTGSLLVLHAGTGGQQLERLSPEGRMIQAFPAPRLGFGFNVSPDGSTIAWVAETGPEEATLGRLSIPSGKTTNATTTASCVDWMPDGRLVRLAADQTAARSVGTVDGSGRIDAMNPSVVPPEVNCLFAFTDSAVLATASGPRSPGVIGPWARLFIVSLNGAEPQELELPASCVLTGVRGSPDKQGIAAALSCGDATENGVYLWSLADPNWKRLVDGYARSLSWSPDGRSIAYLRSIRQTGPSADDVESVSFTLHVTTLDGADSEIAAVTDPLAVRWVNATGR